MSRLGRSGVHSVRSDIPGLADSRFILLVCFPLVQITKVPLSNRLFYCNTELALNLSVTHTRMTAPVFPGVRSTAGYGVSTEHTVKSGHV